MSKKSVENSIALNSKRVQVSFTEDQWNLLTQFKGELGDTDADVVRSIVMIWLAEKNFITDSIKNKLRHDRTDRT
ncbi:MAG: CopG family transcriptional regulator [Candidatus Kapaibacterium sp.]|nr:MAG: CopG family transcriptional regulator [Candidatus Kapabacteria bacterium]